MHLRELLLEKIERTGQGDTAVVGWGRGMGHKGHMYLASSVITHAKELGGDPYFVVSRTVGRDDPITPEEKLAIYRKVFPKQGHIFQTASDEMPDLTRVLTNLNQQGYRNAVVIVGADQVKAFQYLKQYNGKPDKSGNVAFNFDNLDVISRQETSDPSKGEEGPRATPMRQVLLDPTKSDAEQFAVWRDAMNPEVSDDEVRDLMQKAKERMIAMAPAPKKAAAPKKAPAKKKEPEVAEIVLNPARPIGPATGGRPAPTVANPTPAAPAAAPKVTTIGGKEYLRKELPNDMSKVQQGVDDNGNKVYMWIEKSGMRPQYTYYWFAPMNSVKESRDYCRVCGQTPCNCTNIVSETIRKHGSQYQLVSKHGGKNLGTYPTKAGAEKREREVQYFKHKGTNEAAYEGNVGIMELIKFFSMMKDQPEIVKHVKELIADHQDKEVWKIIQKYTGTKLVGNEFNESISIRESINREYRRLKKLNEQR